MIKKLVTTICCVVLVLAAIGVYRFISIIINGNGNESEAYPGNAVTILEQNSLLLNQVAEIFWNRPEAFQSVQEIGESYTQFTVDELFSYPQIQNHFSSEEIQLFQKVVSETRLVSVGMYFPMYGRAQAIRLSFSCSDQSQRVLCYICSTDDDSDQVRETLDYMTYEWVTYPPTNYLNWYVEIRSTSH